MLEIVFYPKNGKEPQSIEVSEALYEWLAKSEFSRIGKSIPKTIYIDGEKQKISVVQLTKGNRRKLREFFLEPITLESDRVLAKLGDSPSKQEYKNTTFRLKKLQELRKCVENEHYIFLER